MCCWTGYSFDLYVLKKVYNLARVCPNRVIQFRVILSSGYCLHDWFDLLHNFFYFKYKKAITVTWICSKVHFVLGPNQSYKIKVVFLYRVCILGMFCLKQGQGFTPLVAQLYLNIGRAPPGILLCILFYHTNPFLSRPLPQSSSTSSSTPSWPSTST